MRMAESGTPIRTTQSSGLGRTAASASIWQTSERITDDSGVGMSGAEKVLSQRILHVTTAFVHQRSQQKISAILNRWQCDEDDPAHQSCFASHKFSLDIVDWNNAP